MRVDVNTALGWLAYKHTHIDTQRMIARQITSTRTAIQHGCKQNISSSSGQTCQRRQNKPTSGAARRKKRSVTSLHITHRCRLKAYAGNVYFGVTVVRVKPEMSRKTRKQIGEEGLF